MDWGFIFQVTLAVLGAALFFGGNVIYRGSASSGVRSSAAAGIASGMAMLAVVSMTLAAGTTYASPDPVVANATGSGPSDASAVSLGR